VLSDRFADDPSFLFGGVNERNPSLELPLLAALVAGADARASFGDIAGA
jgi:hypothetical protein